MNSIVMIDEQNIEKFSGLYAGNITANYHRNSVCYGYLAGDEEDRLVPAALIMSDFVDSSLLITWMYVAPAFRGRNVMLFLMSKFIENAKQIREIKSIYCASTNEDIADYLSAQFAFNYDGYYSGKVMSSTLKSMNDLSTMCKGKNHSMYLRDVNKDSLARLNKFFAANDDIAVGVKLPIKVDDYLDSSMAIVENDEIKAVILMSEGGESLSVSYAFAKKGCEYMFLYLVVDLQKELAKYSSDKRIIATVLNKESEKLFSRMFSEYRVERMYECELPIFGLD